MPKPRFTGLAFSSLTLPSLCEVCGLLQRSAICDACRQRFPGALQRCHTCALPLTATAAPAFLRCGACVHTPSPLHACAAVVDYAFPWANVVARFKYEDQVGLGRSLAQWMLQSTEVLRLLRNADAVIAMPLSRQRLAQRGYNQAHVLVGHLLKGAPFQPTQCVHASHWLERVRDTPEQRQLDKAARLANVRGAFAVADANRSALQGKRLLLVDDVMTSGASLFEAARTLRQAGAAQVSAVVFARTPLL